METPKPPSIKTDTYSVIMLVFGAVMFIVLIALLFTDPLSFFVIGLLLATLGFILFYFGFIKIEKSPNLLGVTYTTAPTPEGVANSSSSSTLPSASSSTLPSADIKPRSLIGPEVFHIADNVFTYDEARAVCQAYDSELASYSQIEQAYNSGAEWCGYGWSEGGLALFPTQEATWERLQREQDPAKRIECGRPGINGGYFDPTTRFGVNCYGVKPTQKLSDKKQMNPENSAFNRLVGQIKDRIDKLLISPFNTKEWSIASSRPRIISSETQTGLAQNVTSVESSVKKIRSGTNEIGMGIISGVVSAVESVGTGITNLVKDII